MEDDKYFETRMTYDKKRATVWKVLCQYFSQWVPYDGAVLELGAGYCDFINNIPAHKKYALDINKLVKKNADKDVTTFVGGCTKIPLKANSVDVVFASNLLEHLDDSELDKTFKEVHRILKPEGKFMIMQPNFAYCHKNYFDDFTHKKIFTHVSMTDYMKFHNFTIARCEPKFLPYSMKSRLPTSGLLLKLYLALPISPFAGQMFVVAQKS